MPDIKLITILPTQTVGGIQQPPGSPGATGQAAGILVSLPTGSILSGYIVNRDPSGNPVLRTDSGDIVFETSFFLRIGSEVVIRIENTLKSTLAHILTVNGQSPEVAEKLSAYTQEPDVIVSPALSARSSAAPAATAATAGAPVPVTAGPPAPSAATSPLSPAAETPAISVTGTLLSPPPGSAAQSALPAGAQVTLQLVALDAPLRTAASTAPPSPPSAPPPAYATYARAAASPPTAALPPATPLPTLAAPDTAAPPAFPPATAPPPLVPGQAIAATVIGREPTGEALVQTPAGIIRLPDMPLPVGSRLTFTVGDIRLPPPLSPANIRPAPLTELAQRWTALEEIGSLLPAQNGSPPGLGALPGLPWISVAPDRPSSAPPPVQIASGLMLFIAALRGGDFAGWLGKDNVRWLADRGHEALLHKAEAEFTAIARQYVDAPPQHWQSLFFPVAVDGQLHQLRLFLKRDRKKSPLDTKKNKEDTRFVIEIDLTRLGEMQLDGFVRHVDREVRFDLVIRSLIPLPGDVQEDLLRIYTETGQLTGYKGSLLFQPVRDFPVNPMEEIVAHALGNIVA